MAAITTRDGVTLHVFDNEAPGRPVVLIHGWPLSGASWENQIGALSRAGYRVIAYDRRGFGRSDKPEDGYDYDTFAADLEAVISGLDLTEVTVVGFSMGGGEVARYIAASGEDRLHSAVFLSAVPPAMLHSEDNPDGPLTPDAAHEMRSGLEQDRDAFFEEFISNFFSVDGELVVPASERHKALDMARQSDHRAALGAMDAFATTDFRRDLGAVTVPTLVVHGDSDDIVPLEGSGARTASAIETASLTVIPGAGHGLLSSHPNEVNEALLAFLAGAGGTEHAAGAAGPAG